MSRDKKEVIEHEQSISIDKKDTVVDSNATSQQHSSEANISPQFFKLAKSLAIDGALLPEDKQMHLEERTVKRTRLSQLRKQKNIESIVLKTLTYCENFEVAQSTDLDWFNRYITLSEEVSNPTMQDLWAKILAGELTKPGSFSYKALKVFRDMSIQDAKLLAKACSLAVKDLNPKNIRLITGVYQKPSLLNFLSKQRQKFCNLSHFGLNHTDLLTLAENHLIYLQESESHLINKDETLQFIYNGVPLKIVANKADVNLQFYKFTPLGTELAQLIGDKGNDGFLEHLKKQLSHYFVVTSD
ncbi:TIGR03899 family protein [Colwellia sp. E2M01]|uniref:TIGR03899 family protein n=1 Tax=Colwellia sp. E2M01 TaxID=2841561 RepID=UPI001C0A0B98|nr:TIGR03899 family protein [Colwellia sp. E2M01]MBU2871437.1 TIGR03899 family protein [Colwellia sp. E2M01]